MYRLFVTLFSLANLLISSLVAGPLVQSVAAPGYGALGYTLPKIGSYTLPVLGVAGNGEVITAAGESTCLYELFNNQYVLLAFIYSSCSDLNGCPLSSHVFYTIKSTMNDDALLAKRLKLISLSFDPEVDTPEVMKFYSNNFRYAGSAGEWQFITTASERKLEPILDSYHQAILKERNSSGDDRTGYSHLLRVFLIDPEKKIRNIYSVDFLHHDLIINDLKNLIVQEKRRMQNDEDVGRRLFTSTRSQPGDNKEGYEHRNYVTRSLDLEMRRGSATDLLAVAGNPPLGLPPLPVPKENPLTKQKIALGRKLFYDRRLSQNGTISCAMCHVPEQGFTSNELAMAVGIEGRTVRRNSPTIYNVAYARVLFHDGREESLEQQIWGPLLAKNEMGNSSVGWVLGKIRRIKDYQGLFEKVFGDRGLSMETLGMALASYQRTLISGDSPFDRWHYAAEEGALPDSAKRGYRLFAGKAGCAACHRIGRDSALFSDHQLHNTGIGFRASMGILPDTQQLTIAPGVTIDIDRSLVETVAAEPPTDVGRYEVTQNPDDRWKYRTPSLRNVALTAPYMHDGSLNGLKEVIDFYDKGGVANELLDPLIRPLGLTDLEKRDLLAFLQSLTGSNVDTLVADAFAAPVGDPGQVDSAEVDLRQMVDSGSL